MRREHENSVIIEDDWDLIIDMPLDGSITNLTGLYSQSGGPSSWVDDPSDNTRKVACFNSKGPVIYPDNDFELKQSVYYKRLKVSLDFWKINYTQGSHPNIIDSSYGLGSPGGLGIGFQITSRSTYNTGLGGNYSGKCTSLSRNSIPIQTWIRWEMEWNGDIMSVTFTNLNTNTIIHQQIFDLTGNYTVSTDRSKTIIRLGANNQWSDDRTSYSYIRNFKMWLHKKKPQLLVDAPLNGDILDHSGNGNHPVQQSYTPTYNDNALYITGVNRGITLNCVDFTQIWQNFKMEMDVKWASQKNCGLWILAGTWANSKNMIGCIKDSSQSYLSFWQYAASQQNWSLNLWPVNVWIHFSLEIYRGMITIVVTRLDTNAVISTLQINQTQTEGYANNILRIGGGFSYSQYWNGWIKNFKLYKYE